MPTFVWALEQVAAAGWTPLAGCETSQDALIALPVMAGDCRCLFLLTLGHLARCLFPLPFLSLLPANKQDKVLPLSLPFPPPLQVFCTLTAVSLSSPSSPRSSSLPMCSSCNPATAKSAVAAVPAIAPFRSEWVDRTQGDGAGTGVMILNSTVAYFPYSFPHTRLNHLQGS